MSNQSYYSYLNKFKKIVAKCKKVSKKFANIPSPSPQHFYASVLFTRLCVIAVSLERLLPTKTTDHWDYASVASLTRNILECYLTFFICV